MKAQKEQVPPGELRDVDVKFISLVNKGANKRQFQVFKAAEDISAQEPTDEQVRGIGRAIWKAVKSLVAPEQIAVQKAEGDLPTFAGLITQQDVADDLYNARWVLNDVMVAILQSDAENKAALIGDAIDQYRAYVMSRLAQVGITKALEEVTKVQVEKAGKSISAANRAKLQLAVAALNELLALDAENDEGGGVEVNKQELEQVVGAAISKALEPVTKRLEQLEKGEGTEAQADDLTADKVEELVSAAVAKAVEPVAQRVEALEQARGGSQAGYVEDAPVIKSGSGAWGGIFL